MDIELIVLLALLLGAGAAAATTPQQPEDEPAAQEPSFFQFPDFNLTFPSFPAFPSVDTGYATQPAADMPYWYAEIQRMYPGVPIKVGPSA